MIRMEQRMSEMVMPKMLMLDGEDEIPKHWQAGTN